MKKNSFLLIIVVTFSLLTLVLTSHAQKDKINSRFTENSMFLFNSFIDGEAYYNDEGISKGIFNYNVVYEEISFIKENQILTISNSSELDSIRIGNKSFLHKDKKIYEIISSGKIKVLLYRKPDLSSSKPTGAYGTSSNTSSVSKKTSFYTGKAMFGGEHINIQDKSDTEIPILKKIYLLINNELILASKSQIYKRFNDHKTEIKTYISEKNIDLQEKNDLIKLTVFLEKFI